MNEVADVLNSSTQSSKHFNLCTKKIHLMRWYKSLYKEKVRNKFQIK